MEWKEGSMANDGVDARINRLLDQLDNPDLTPAQLEMVRTKIDLVKEQS
jgi:hypothetical protein